VIITNDAIIAVNQDPAGSPANRIWKRPVSGGDLSLYQGNLVNKYVSFFRRCGCFLITTYSTFVIALLNTSPNTQKVDVLMSDAFMDQVRTLFMVLYLHHAHRRLLLQGPVAAAEPWNLFDLWQKDSSGKWGKSVGTVQGKIAGVIIGPHQTKVWRAVPARSRAKRAEL
jgi:alpha-galactosidase